MLAALWALLLSDVRLTSLPSAPRLGDDRSALLRGGAQSQTLQEWSDSEADALWAVRALAVASLLACFACFAACRWLDQLFS